MKRTQCLLLSALLCLAFLTGCQPTPDIPPVASKNDGTLEYALANGAEAGYTYNLPKNETYVKDYYDGLISVSLDSSVLKAQEGVTYPVYETSIEKIPKELVENVIKTSFGDNAELVVHLRPDEKLTKSEIMDIISTWQNQLENIKNGTYEAKLQRDEDGIYYYYDEEGNNVSTGYHDKEQLIADETDSFNNAIEEYRKKYLEAPEEITEKPTSLDYYRPGLPFNVDIKYNDGQERVGRLSLNETWMAFSKNISSPYDDTIIQEERAGVDDRLSIDDRVDASGKPMDDEFHKYILEDGMSYDNSVKKAEEFIKEIGIENMEVEGVYVGDVGNEYVYSDNEPKTTIYIHTHAVNFMRKITDTGLHTSMTADLLYNSCADGTVIDENDNPDPDNYASPFYYEKLVVYVTNEGVGAMWYSSPLKIERTVQESVEVNNDFNTIVTTIGNIEQGKHIVIGHELMDVQEGNGGILYSGYKAIKSPEKLAEQVEYIDVELTDAELGYTMVKEKDETERYLLIPAWHITKRTVIKAREDYEPSETDSINFEYFVTDDCDVTEYHSILVNGIDGSVINTHIGY